MIAISHKELKALPPIGHTMKCWRCGEEHPVEESTPPGLSFFKCGGHVYVCGVDGKAWRPKEQ